jgi:ribosomal-protein-alanine N-acetyltransferase
MPHNHEQQVRLLDQSDLPALERLLRTSEYIYQRFTLNELSLLLTHYPAVGTYHKTTIYGFLIAQLVNPPTAWIGGFGVSWTESKRYISILTALLEHLDEHLARNNVRYLHYSGNDSERDWLRGLLLAHGFVPYRQLYAYDKFDFSIPNEGNSQIHIRPVRLAPLASSADTTAERTQQDDMAALLEIEQLCFEELWRYDRVAFRDIAATHPYFVVAELNGQVVGYQFNACDDDLGYLVRIAVHPTASRQGIGIRLMAEAIRYFQRERVSRIMLNTQEDNYHAHNLYEWFGFIRLSNMGFVLRKTLHGSTHSDNGIG